jgi:FkbM family methyltransferase
MYYSQYGQDSFIHHNLLSDTDSNIFIDIGAYDGIEGSNTKFFEEYLGWDGICFEPNPKLFERLQNNRKCQCVCGAAWDNNEQQTFRMIEGYSEMLSGIVSELAPEHINRIEQECKIHNGKYVDVPVDCYDINSFLLTNEITNITYFSLDTEGSEFRVLKALDLNAIHIKIFSVENNYGDNTVYNYLTSFGYRKAASLGIDDIYVKHA